MEMSPNNDEIPSNGQIMEGMGATAPRNRFSTPGNLSNQSPQVARELINIERKHKDLDNQAKQSISDVNMIKLVTDASDVDEIDRSYIVDPEEDGGHGHSHDVRDDRPVGLDDSGQPYKLDIVWRNIVLFVILHTGALYGLGLMLTKAKLATWLWVVVLHIFGGFGITGGAHRLWTHRSFKATLTGRIIFMIFNCVALQNDVIEWSRDHRVHHKFSETDADPHNARRGFFFSHMGWLCVRKHPDVLTKGKTVDMSDLYKDSVLVFQRKFYLPLVIFFCFVVPTVVPMLWGESAWVAYFVAGLFRYCFTLHMTWTVNSLAHIWGYKPYDKTINPTQNLVSTLGTLGEGWHNYHHTFPYDYRASEWAWRINLSTVFIDAMAGMGLVYDRRQASESLIQRRKDRTGDKTGQYWGRNENYQAVPVVPTPVVTSGSPGKKGHVRSSSFLGDQGGDLLFVGAALAGAD